MPTLKQAPEINVEVSLKPMEFGLCSIQRLNVLKKLISFEFKHSPVVQSLRVRGSLFSETTMHYESDDKELILEGDFIQMVILSALAMSVTGMVKVTLGHLKKLKKL